MTTYFGYGKENGQEVKELLSMALKHYEAEKTDLLLKVDSNVQKFKSLKEQPNASKYSVGESSLGYDSSYWFQFKPYWGSAKDIESVASLNNRKADIESVINKYIADCEAVYEENKPIIEHNQTIVEKVTKLMQAIGIPNSYSTSSYKTTRSRTRTTETHSAGYLSDISRNIKTSQQPVPDKKRLLDSMQRKYDELVRKARDIENKAEQERKEKEAIHEIALLRAKYTPDDAMSGAWELIDGILSKDKYLRLAYYLEKNRGDWSDGYDYAESGLNGFVVEEGNSLDQDIYDCISRCIESGNDGDIDGRIFRDCEYNYNHLYGLVTNAQLQTDLDKVKAWGGDDE